MGNAQAQELLVLALNDAAIDVREETIAALDQIDINWPKSEAAQHAIPRLIGALYDEDLFLQKHAEELLDKIDPEWPKSEDAKLAVPALIALLGDESPSTCESVAETLGRTGDVRAVSPLSAKLKDVNPRVRRAAALALGNLGSAGKDATAALTAALEDEEASVRQAAQEALIRISDKPPSA